MRPFYHIYQSVSLLCPTGSFTLSLSLSLSLFFLYFDPFLVRILLLSPPSTVVLLRSCFCTSCSSCGIFSSLFTSCSSFDCIYLSVSLFCCTGSFPLSLLLVLRSTYRNFLSLLTSLSFLFVFLLFLLKCRSNLVHVLLPCTPTGTPTPCLDRGIDN